jgi:hypothetical protein
LDAAKRDEPINQVHSEFDEWNAQKHRHRISKARDNHAAGQGDFSP